MRSQANQKKRQKHSLLWGAVYALIAAIFLYGVYLVVLQSVIIVPRISPPPTYAPPTQAQALTPSLTPPPKIADAKCTPEPTPEPTPYVRRLPVRIYFTKPGYWSDVYPVKYKQGSDTEIGTLDSAVDAAWFELGAAPRQSGNCIINGHDSFDSRKGVFAYLKEISYGEEVVVELDNGEFVYYEVRDKQEFLYYEFPPVFISQLGMDRLTLITCKGDRVGGTSQTRVVVICTEKSAPPDNAPLLPDNIEQEGLPAPPS